MVQQLNKNIVIVEDEIKKHCKASEIYIHVKMIYSMNYFWDGWVPIEYRRTGLSLRTKDEIINYLNDVYMQMNPEKVKVWKKEQDEFWNGRKAEVTKSFFDSLIKGGWQCVECTLPKNPNWARRIQDLKELGYTIATDTNRYCPICKAKKTHLILLPIKRGIMNGNGYETWTPALRKRIIKVLGSVDIYENVQSAHCLPDHKFSEIRWDDNTKTVNPENMSDEEIRSKFQLLNNQRNQQKREVCRKCFQTNKRGYPFGIKYYYKGTENWDKSIPKKGKEAEKGCIGCGWYDILKWRKNLINKLRK